jgi:hypothetical protein
LREQPDSAQTNNKTCHGVSRARSHTLYFRESRVLMMFHSALRAEAQWFLIEA